MMYPDFLTLVTEMSKVGSMDITSVEKELGLFLYTYGNYFLLKDSVDENNGLVYMVLQNAMYRYNKFIKLNDLDLLKLIGEIYIAEGETFNPKNLKRDELDDSFLAAYQRSTGNKTVIWDKYEELLKNYQSAEQIFYNDMTSILMPVVTGIIRKDVWDVS